MRGASDGPVVSLGDVAIAVLVAVKLAAVVLVWLGRRR